MERRHHAWRRLARAALALAAAAATAGCGSQIQSEYPIGIGSGPNSLKQSPCAGCDDLPNRAQEPGFRFPEA